MRDNPTPSGDPSPSDALRGASVDTSREAVEKLLNKWAEPAGGDLCSVCSLTWAAHMGVRCPTGGTGFVSHLEAAVRALLDEREALERELDVAQRRIDEWIDHEH